jgi:hypothetical protein|eukprot:scaffold1094_cov185-Alexandrium_tamarense.AAC.21
MATSSSRDFPSHGDDSITSYEQRQENESDFFGMFNFTSDGTSTRSDVNIGSSLRKTIGQPLHGAATSLVSFWSSAFDTAFAVFNDDFAYPSKSMTSTTTYGEEDQPMTDSLDEMKNDSETKCDCSSVNKNISGCSRRPQRSKKKEHYNDDTPSTFEETASTTNTTVNADRTDENSSVTSQHSLIASISTLWPKEESSDGLDAADIYLFNPSNQSLTSLIRKFDDDNRSNDEPTYCFVENENETKDGWLVVSED